MIKKWFGLICCACVVAACATTQKVETPRPQVVPKPETLPIDPAVRSGKLANGLRYVIRENKRPENRAELRLVVDAGSILEDADQRGLAHFVEHMAFNGTANFPKQDIVNFLEGIGMRFGPDLNAYTSFDETVYMLQVPTDSAAVMEKAFRILGDWAHRVEFDPEEIEKERGVVIEEWRSGRGAGARMRDEQLPVLLKDSRYAERLPIGQKALLDTFKHASLTRYYRDWYRPDLMGVIAVGDFSADAIEALIKKTFAPIPKAENPRGRTAYTVPDHAETLFAIATDPENSRSSVSVYFLREVAPEGTVENYRSMLIRSMFNSMLNQRFDEMIKKPNPPFLGAGSSHGNLVRTKAAYILGAGVEERGIERGLEAILTEALRVQRHGFTLSEVDRLKTNMLRSIEQAYRERDKRRSGGFASEYIRHFLTGEPIPGIEIERALFQKLLPGIQAEEINRLVGEWLTAENRVIVVSAPEKAGLPIPSEAELSGILNAVQQKEVEPYREEVSDDPLIAHLPTPGPVVRETTIDTFGVTEWTLSNGVTVVMKPTDFKNDEVLFTAFSPGGHSLASDENYIAASTATAAIMEGGLGEFSQIDLKKKLAGKVVRVSPGISGLSERVSGSASPEDLETMFQLIYLMFTEPRADSLAFRAFRDRYRAVLQNRGMRPETAYSDTIQVTMSQYHFRSRPLSNEILLEMDLQKSLAFYKDRFADASDFTFVFVGNFAPEKIKPLIETYLGGLPALNRTETWRDTGIRPPKGVIEKTIRRGREPKSRTRLIFTGPFDWDDRFGRYAFDSMGDVLNIKLREVLREDEGGTYGVGVRTSVSRWPEGGYSISISFGCNPARLEELTQLVFVQIDSMKQKPVDRSYIDKVTEMDLRRRETNLKENRYWRNTLQWYYQHDKDMMALLKYEDEIVKKLTAEDVQQATQQYFNMKNYGRFVLLPEGETKKSKATTEEKRIAD